MARSNDELVEERVLAARMSFRILRPVSAEALIDEADYERDERLPYWAELWPSALVLSEALAESDLCGKRVVELGCGVGLPSLVAARLGAEVVAADWYDDAVKVVRLNAARNGITGIEALCASWEEHDGALHARAPFDILMAADVLYEERHVAALGRLIPALLSRSGVALIADPRRPYAQHLSATLTDVGWAHSRRDHPVPGRVDEQGPVCHVHELRPPGATP